MMSLRDRVDDWALGAKRGVFASAVCRIGTGLAVFGLLASNWTTRDMWVGQASVWAEPARAVSTFPEVVLLRGVSSDVLALIYAVTMLASLALVLGWRTKAANVVTFIGFIAIVGQNPVVGAPGDNLIRLTLMWMLLMRTAEHWSLDAVRRRRRAASGKAASREQDALPEWLSTGLHNVGLFALCLQTVLSSAAAGLDKVADRGWQHGTALFSTMQLPEFRPFPALSDVVSGSSVLLALLTYGLLLSQLFLGPLLLNPVARRFVIGLALVVNAAVGVVFGQPWSAISTLAVLGLFVSDGTWLRVEGWCIERGYDLLDRLDDLRYRLWFPAVDWARTTLVRR